jgi:hypothetical protein
MFARLIHPTFYPAYGFTQFVISAGNAEIQMSWLATSIVVPRFLVRLGSLAIFRIPVFWIPAIPTGMTTLLLV